MGASLNDVAARRQRRLSPDAVATRGQSSRLGVVGSQPSCPERFAPCKPDCDAIAGGRSSPGEPCPTATAGSTTLRPLPPVPHGPRRVLQKERRRTEADGRRGPRRPSRRPAGARGRGAAARRIDRSCRWTAGRAASWVGSGRGSDSSGTGLVQYSALGSWCQASRGHRAMAAPLAGSCDAPVRRLAWGVAADKSYSRPGADSSFRARSKRRTSIVGRIRWRGRLPTEGNSAVETA